jgi:hypothetical protein
MLPSIFIPAEDVCLRGRIGEWGTSAGLRRSLVILFIWLFASEFEPRPGLEDPVKICYRTKGDDVWIPLC